MRRPLTAACFCLLLGCDGNCPPDASPGCVDNRDCEEVYRDWYQQQLEIYDRCGFGPDAPDEPTEIPSPCDEALKAFLLCVEDCAYEIPCGAIDGTDMDAHNAVQDCFANCPPDPR